jgi:hypothetical protein
MSPAQRQLAWSGSIVAVLLAVTTARELGKTDNCREQLVRWVDGGGSTLTSKARVCD